MRSGCTFILLASFCIIRLTMLPTRYWFTNFAQPLRGACEPPPGATGLASSADGKDWARASSVPLLDTLPAHGAQPWEQIQIYAPNLVVHDVCAPTAHALCHSFPPSLPPSLPACLPPSLPLSLSLFPSLSISLSLSTVVPRQYSAMRVNPALRAVRISSFESCACSPTRSVDGMDFLGNGL